MKTKMTTKKDIFTKGDMKDQKTSSKTFQKSTGKPIKVMLVKKTKPTANPSRAMYTA